MTTQTHTESEKKDIHIGHANAHPAFNKEEHKHEVHNQKHEGHEHKHDEHQNKEIDKKAEEPKAENKELKMEAKKSPEAKTEIKQEQKTEEKPSVKKDQKKVDKKIVKKEEAIALGRSLPVSKRQCMYICSFIKNKKIDQAISDLEQVIKFKKVIPFKGEIPHRKGSIMSGRYPIKASKLIIKVLKSLKGNALVNGLDLEKTKIVEGSSNWASRPMRSEGRRAKRTHILLKAKEIEIE